MGTSGSPEGAQKGARDSPHSLGHRTQCRDPESPGSVAGGPARESLGVCPASPRPSCGCRHSPLLGLGPGLAHQVSRTPRVGFPGAIETWLHSAGRAGSRVGSFLQARASAPLPQGPGCGDEACPRPGQGLPPRSPSSRPLSRPASALGHAAEAAGTPGHRGGGGPGSSLLHQQAGRGRGAHGGGGGSRQGPGPSPGGTQHLSGGPLSSRCAYSPFTDVPVRHSHAESRPEPHLRPAGRAVPAAAPPPSRQVLGADLGAALGSCGPRQVLSAPPSAPLRDPAATSLLGTPLLPASTLDTFSLFTEQPESPSAPKPDPPLSPCLKEKATSFQTFLEPHRSSPPAVPDCTPGHPSSPMLPPHHTGSSPLAGDATLLACTLSP